MARKDVVVEIPADQSLYVIIHADTGVFYQHQCGGVGCYQNEAEGYLMALHMDELGVRKVPLATLLTDVFHEGDGCCAPWWTGESLPTARMGILREIVAGIPMYGVTRMDGKMPSIQGMILDESRLGQVTEGWVPVLTKVGPGTLIFENCD